MKKYVALLLTLMLLLSMSTCAFADSFTANARGFGGQLSVTLTIEENDPCNCRWSR